MPRAVIIDDFYARPTADELRQHLAMVRQVITEDASGALKAWFDTEFTLAGDHMTGAYFDPLLSDVASIRRFWERRDQSPAGPQLPAAFQALIDLLAPAQACLAAIEAALASLKWQYDTYPALPPSPQNLGADLQFIAVDYVLKPLDPSPGVEETKKFLREVVSNVTGNPKLKCPYVFLISENHAAKTEADPLRKFVELPGAYFRFEEKPNVTTAMVTRMLNDFVEQQGQLEAFRNLHNRLQAAIGGASQSLGETFRHLELQDLATLHAGQLVQEGEPFGDYIAWLVGQFLSQKLLTDAELAKASAALADSGFSVMLGHMSPTQDIAKIFSQVAVCRPESTLLRAESTRKILVRFGDLFVAMSAPNVESRKRRSLAAASRGPAKRWVSKRRPATRATSKFLLVISQTCDLHHCNITNDQVLCLEGSSRRVMPSEADLLRATIKQMDERVAAIMVRDGAEYSEITWSTKDLRSVDRAKLETQSGYRYVGRVNEIYAMQAQNSALQELGRVGVPIQPAYSMFYGAAKIRIYSGAQEEQQLAADFDKGLVTAVIINEKSKDREFPKSQHRLTISEELRAWLIGECSRLENDAGWTNPQLKTSIGRFRAKLEKAPAWSLFVKVDKNGITTFYEVDAAGKAETKALPNVQIILGVPFQIATSANARLVIELGLVTKEPPTIAAGG